MALPKFIAHLSDSPNSRIFFVNHVEDYLKWPKKLSELLAVEEVLDSVLEIYGEVDKNKKILLLAYSPTPLIFLG